MPLSKIGGECSFYFSIGNGRVRTKNGVGFSLILLGEIIPGLDNPNILAMAHIIGTI